MVLGMPRTVPSIVQPLQKTRLTELIANQQRKVKLSHEEGKLSESSFTVKNGKFFFSKVPHREIVTYQSRRDGGVSLVNRKGQTLAHIRAGSTIPVLNQLPAGVSPTLKITPVFITGVGRRRFF